MSGIEGFRKNGKNREPGKQAFRAAKKTGETPSFFTGLVKVFSRLSLVRCTPRAGEKRALSGEKFRSSEGKKALNGPMNLFRGRKEAVMENERQAAGGKRAGRRRGLSRNIPFHTARRLVWPPVGQAMHGVAATKTDPDGRDTAAEKCFWPSGRSLPLNRTGFWGRLPLSGIFPSSTGIGRGNAVLCSLRGDEIRLGPLTKTCEGMESAGEAARRQEVSALTQIF